MGMPLPHMPPPRPAAYNAVPPPGYAAIKPGEGIGTCGDGNTREKESQGAAVPGAVHAAPTPTDAPSGDVKGESIPKRKFQEEKEERTAEEKRLARNPYSVYASNVRR